MVPRPLLAFLLAPALGCSIESAGLFADDAAADGSPSDSGGRDATLMDATADATAGDASGADATTDAGSADAGCAPIESCAAPIDEDCDGIVDEGCDWHFGRPSPLVRLHRSENHHYSPVLSVDGQRLYYYASLPDTTAAPRGAIHVASRAAPTDRFGAPAIVGGFDDVTPYSFTLSDDELEIIVEILPASGPPTRLYRAIRASRTDAFGPRELLDVRDTTTERELNPHLSRDGTELFFISQTAGAPRLYRSTRAAPGMPFSVGAIVDLGTASYYTPHLTRDGLTLFIGRMGQIWAATRSSQADPFGAPVPVAELPTDGQMIFPFVSQGTSEVFFVSDRPWSPAVMSLWRARICRDGPCSEASVDCADGTTSPDQRHCYLATGASEDVDAARARCVEADAMLPTLHSPEERDILRSLTSGIQWTAGNDLTTENVFVWETGEPWLYAPWRAGEPDGARSQNYVELRDTYDISDAAPSDANDVVCERELWPW